MSAQLQEASRIEARVEKLQDDLARLHGVVHGRLNSESIAKILLIFWGVLSVGFAVFGVRSLDDIRSNIKLIAHNELDAYVLKEKESLDGLVEAIKDATQERDAFLAEHGDNMMLLRHLKNVSDEAIASDLEGRVERLIFEAQLRTSETGEAMLSMAFAPGVNEEQRAKLLSATKLDPAWRSGALSTLTLLDDLLGNGGNFDPNKLFNVTQVARGIGAFDTSNRLANHLDTRYAIPAYRAVALNSRIRISKDSKEVEAGFSELMELVATLGPQEPQIVLAEAWNGAEYLRRYADFIAAIERLERASAPSTDVPSQSPKALPSYAYVIKAQALLRDSRPGSVERARFEMANAANALRKESTHSQWYESTIQEGRQVAELLEASSQVGAKPFDVTANGETELDIDELLQALSALRQAQDADRDDVEEVVDSTND